MQWENFWKEKKVSEELKAQDECIAYLDEDIVQNPEEGHVMSKPAYEAESWWEKNIVHKTEEVKPDADVDESNAS